MTPMQRTLALMAGLVLGSGSLAAQVTPPAPPPVIQNATLRRALQAYDNVDFGQVIPLARAALRERLMTAERARAYELLAFAFAATNQPDSAITAFREVLQLDPDRDLDPRRVSPRIAGYFNAALGQVMVVRQLRVDSAAFVAGQGAVPIKYHITSSARVRVRAVSPQTSVTIDSSVTVGQVNLRWPARLPNGDAVPPGQYTIVVEAAAGQNTYSASQPVRIAHGAVDTLPHLTQLPGYQFLPETEVPAKSWRPMGIALMGVGAALAGSLAVGSDLGKSSGREIGTISAATLITGFIMTLKKPAPQPSRGNLMFNQLLREQVGRRNQEIARDNAQRRQQVQINVVPLPKPGGAR
jgi:hypothetical protein